MSWDEKLAKLHKKRNIFNHVEGCTLCRVYSTSKGIKLVVLGTEHNKNPLKFIKNVTVNSELELKVGNRVLVAFIQGDITKPAVICKVK